MMEEYEKFAKAWMVAVRKNRALDARAKALLLALVSYDGNRDHPGKPFKGPTVEQLAKDTGMSPRLVTKSLEDVQREGFITITEGHYALSTPQSTYA